MSPRRIAMLTIAPVLLAVSIGTAQPPADEVTTALTQPSMVPPKVFDGIQKEFDLPSTGASQEEKVARMNRVIQIGTQAEADYPDAANISSVRDHMLRAASWLAFTNGDAVSRKQLQEIAGRILNSEATANQKVVADFLATLVALRSDPPPPPESVAKRIEAFAERYRKTEGEAQSLVHGTMLAEQTRNTQLRERYLKALESNHSKDPLVRPFLKSRGRSPYVGAAFEADLTRLDGSKLKLPNGLLGKVVVVDFWATWCGPCVAEVPHMKKVYQQYKDKGVEFVGISLDKSREKLTDFIEQRGLGWVHTFSGKAWEDPTAAAYGVRGIPSIWVIGKDGKVVSDNARANLETTIEKALAAPVRTNNDKQE